MSDQTLAEQEAAARADVTPADALAALWLSATLAAWRTGGDLAREFAAAEALSAALILAAARGAWTWEPWPAVLPWAAPAFWREVGGLRLCAAGVPAPLLNDL